jgi:hypothetical protein
VNLRADAAFPAIFASAVVFGVKDDKKCRRQKRDEHHEQGERRQGMFYFPVFFIVSIGSINNASTP